MTTGQPGSSKHNTVITRVPVRLIEDITEYSNKKYGTKIPFSQAALNYAIDNKLAREALNKRGGNNFL